MAAAALVVEHIGHAVTDHAADPEIGWTASLGAQSLQRPFRGIPALRQFAFTEMWLQSLGVDKSVVSYGHGVNYAAMVSVRTNVAVRRSPFTLDDVTSGDCDVTKMFRFGLYFAQSRALT